MIGELDAAGGIDTVDTRKSMNVVVKSCPT